MLGFGFDLVILSQVNKHYPTKKEMLMNHLLVLILTLFWVKTLTEGSEVCLSKI